MVTQDSVKPYKGRLITTLINRWKVSLGQTITSELRGGMAAV